MRKEMICQLSRHLMIEPPVHFCRESSSATESRRSPLEAAGSQNPDAASLDRQSPAIEFRCLADVGQERSETAELPCKSIGVGMAAFGVFREAQAAEAKVRFPPWCFSLR